MANRSPRAEVAQTLHLVRTKGRSTAELMPDLIANIAERDRGFARELLSGTLRWMPRLEFVLSQLLNKPIKAKEAVIHSLLLTGLYQLYYMRVPAHAALNETVNATRQLNKKWAGSFVNATLRRAHAERDALLALADEQPETRYAHPAWLVGKLRKSWPEHWEAILQANNLASETVLRARPQHGSREAMMTALEQAEISFESGNLASQSIVLNKAGDVAALPGFNEGHFVVQDEAAQLAAELLAPQANERVLDACAAPGGKSCHILDMQPQLAELVALDIDENRQRRVIQNLERLDLKATVLVGDASNQEWWDEQLFDRILLDAPCSATGVIRRHPDIKIHRQPDDIANLAGLQNAILANLWAMLKPGGVLLYATCSVLPQENTKHLEQFLAQQSDALELPIDAQWGIRQPVGRQILPGMHNSDGFYYALLQKKS